MTSNGREYHRISLPLVNVGHAKAFVPLDFILPQHAAAHDHIHARIRDWTRETAEHLHDISYTEDHHKLSHEEIGPSGTST